MTTRVKGLTVVLDADYREDDIQRMIDAIECFSGVVKVTKIERDANDFINRTRIRNEIGEKLLDIVYPKEPHDGG